MGYEDHHAECRITGYSTCSLLGLAILAACAAAASLAACCCGVRGAFSMLPALTGNLPAVGVPAVAYDQNIMLSAG